jgi:hypothetical protein
VHDPRSNDLGANHGRRDFVSALVRFLNVSSFHPELAVHSQLGIQSTLYEELLNCHDHVGCFTDDGACFVNGSDVPWADSTGCGNAAFHLCMGNIQPFGRNIRYCS